MKQIILSILSLAIALACPSTVALAKGSESDEPGHVPGYEEAKERANLGLSVPTGKEVVKLPELWEEPMGPIFGGSFLGDTESFTNPPDLTIAVGQNHLIVATNQFVKIFDKLGNFLESPGGNLCGFFNQDGTTRCTGTDTTPISDPKVAYDEYINRFWVTAVSVNDVSGPARSAMIFIALSNGGDPTAGWSLFAIDGMAEFNQRGLRDSGLWCDYPQLGIDAQAIYVSCNMYSFTDGIVPPFFHYAKVRVMTKGQFIAPTQILWWDFFDGDLCEGLFCLGRSFTLQPARMHGANPADGEFLIDSNSLLGDSLVVRRITGAERCCAPGAQSAPILQTADHGVGTYAIPRDARQTGTPSRISTSDARLQFAIYQGGLLSTGQNLACGFLSGACVAFTEFDVSGFPNIRTVNDWVLDSPPELDHFYPAVEVNAADNKTMVFSRSGENDFASAAFVGIPSSNSCTRCVDGPERTLIQGSSTFTQGRWGDYSGAATDPDGRGIWLYGEFVSAPNTWSGQFAITQRPLLNPIPQIFSISPPNAFVGASDLTLTLTGADFVPGAVVRWNGSDRATTFVGERLIRANIPASDLQAEGVAQVTVFNPAPGGGLSTAVGFYVCGGTILFTGPNNGAWQTPGNWNTGNLPGPGDAVCIGPTSRVVLSFNSYTIGSLRSYGGLEISSNGSLAITGSSFINNAFTLTVNGTLDGSGDLTVNGTFVWQRGTVRGSGTLTANGSIALSDGGNGYRNLIGRTLTNVTAASWTDNQIFQLSEGAVFNNQGTFEAQNDQPFVYGDGTPVAFNNSGTFRKSVGTGMTIFVIAFNNTGTVMVQSGTLELRRTDISSGDYNVSSAATLRFREDRTLAGSVSGAGTVSFDAPINTYGIVNITGTYNVSGTTSINHSTVNFNPGMTLLSLGVLALDDSATVNLSSGTPIAQSTFTLAGLSTLTGSDSFTVTNLFTWKGGTISGSGAFIANGGISFGTPPNYKYLAGRTLTNVGSASWADGYQVALFLNDGAIFDNQGSFEARDDANIATASGVVAFNNAGTFQKSAGTGLSGMFVPFNNSGTVTIQSGTLFLNAAYTQVAGSTVLNGGGLQSAPPGTMNIQGGTLSGLGNLTASLGNSATVSPGGPTNPGLLNVIGSYTTQDPINASLSFRIGGRNPSTDFDQLAVTGYPGSATLGGTLNVSLVGGFTPMAGDTFRIVTFGSGGGTFAATNLPPLPGGLTWNVQYSPTSVTLGVLGP